MCFVWIWEQTAISYLYSVNWLVSVTRRSVFTVRYGLKVHLQYTYNCSGHIYGFVSLPGAMLNHIAELFIRTRCHVTKLSPCSFLLPLFEHPLNQIPKTLHLSACQSARLGDIPCLPIRGASIFIKLNSYSKYWLALCSNRDKVSRQLECAASTGTFSRQTVG